MRTTAWGWGGWAIALAGMCPAWGAAAAFSADSVVVYRVGDGVARLNGNAAAVFLDEYTFTGELRQSIAMPTAPSGALSAFTATGNSGVEGRLSLSADGGALVAPGYSALPGGSTAVANPATTPRVVARIDAAGGISTLPVAALSGRVYAAVSADGHGAYMSGSSGIAYIDQAGQSTKLLAGQTFDMAVEDGQLYYTNGTNPGIYALGDGLPTSGSPAGRPVVPVVGGSPRSFTFADLSHVVSGMDTLYVSDTIDFQTVVSKYSKQASGEWAYRQSLPYRAFYLTSRVVDGQAQIFGTDQGRLLSLTDSAGYDGVIEGEVATLATAAAKTSFLGVAFAPTIPEASTPALALAGMSCAMLLGWRRQTRSRWLVTASTSSNPHAPAADGSAPADAARR